MTTTQTPNTTARRRYTVAHGNTTNACYDIHAFGCSHVTKATFKVFGNATGTSAEAVRNGLAKNMAEQGWTPEMLRVMDCCASAPIA